MKTLNPQKTVIIGVEGGLVQWILSDVPDLEAIVMDYDTDGFVDDETGEEPKVVGQIGVDGPLSMLEPSTVRDLKDRGYVIGGE